MRPSGGPRIGMQGGGWEIRDEVVVEMSLCAMLRLRWDDNMRCQCSSM